MRTRFNQDSLFKIGVVVLLIASMMGCAKRSSLTGGSMDTLPPVFVKAIPPNYTTSFDKEEIRIYFDEYVKLKDYQKQLIISPPLKNSIISPQGTASKYITVSILDTLMPNTTYVFNFGQSIVDNNEGNPYSYFKYIFSTGSYIDSLKVKGRITDALSQQPDNFVTVMLYEVDSTFTDSVVYKETPRYVTNTLDSLTTFELSNLKEGRYLLAALKDEDANYTFQPKKDKIAYLEEYITVPTDSSYILNLFKEESTLDISRPRHVAAQRIAFGVEGPIDSLKFDVLSHVEEGFESTLSRKRDQDTLNYWFKPKVTADSLNFVASGSNYRDTVTVKMRKLYADSLTVTPITKGILVLEQPLEIDTSIPPATVVDSLITIVDRDTISIPFQSEIDRYNSLVRLRFETEEDQKYSVLALPGAINDFFGNKSDTLSYKINTKERVEYGDLEFKLLNAKNYPYIIQLLDEGEEVVQEQYAIEGEQNFTFNLLQAKNYWIRLIEDANKNKRYDTGNFLNKIQPERVIYYPKLIEIRAGWLPRETFTLRDN